MKIKGIKKVINVGEDELGEWDLCGYDQKESKVKADVFIYSYSDGGYDGSGMAVWRKDGKWSYDDLGHCSCYGPTEHIQTSDKIKVTLKQLIKLLKDNYSYQTQTEDVLNYLSKNYKK